MIAKSHPDLVAEIICDSLLDVCLSKNKHVRTGIEAMVCPNKVILAGEIGGVELTDAEIDSTVRSAVRELGYTREEYGFNADTLVIDNNLHQQSADIAQGVVGEEGKIAGAGDIGLMFGYACNETKAMIPVQLFIPRELMRLHDSSNQREWGIRPDAKCEIAIDKETGESVFVICISHDEDADVDAYVEHLLETMKAQHPEWRELIENSDIHINPTGKFVICGPFGDSGLNGRKIVAVQYGGAAPVGGGAFGGKCPSKVDRSAAYMARYLATEIIRDYARDLSDEVIVGLGYAIGEPQPVSIEIRSNFLTDEEKERLIKSISERYDLSPQGICDFLHLKDIKYVPTSVNGAFGVSIFRSEEDLKSFPWEAIAIENQKSY